MISKNYEKYLSHFRKTVTLDEFHHDSLAPGLCALRHDVDRDLDLALEMAHFEHERGFRSTYFILPGTAYWRTDTKLIDKCLQLEDYGHEVGLHVNSLAEWVSGETEDIACALQGQLATLRNAGVRVHGIAAHGDRRCYEHHLSNYWCFQELRPASPYDHENGRTAEGPHEADGTTKLLYPQDHIATRSDGGALDLWSISMQSMDLRYHAWHTKFDRYFSDSAGGWKRTTDPIKALRGEDRWQVLIHPEHWRGPSKYYFFLSCARSGSKWLSEVLSAATPLHTRHEYVLNQPFHRGETSRKATTDVWALEDNEGEVSAKLTEAWEEFENQSRDFAEVNVYLEGFASQLQAAFPEAMFVQLKRAPALVVSSLMDRNWYDTPEDRCHPRLRGVDAKSIGQFERVCHYVAQVNRRLNKVCSHLIDLDELTKSPLSLASEIEKLGIAYHSRLGQPILERVSNARKEKNFPDPVNWDENQEQALECILSGAKDTKATVAAQISKTSANLWAAKLIKEWLAKFFGNDVSSFKLDVASFPRILTKFCSLQYNKNQSVWVVATDTSEKNAYLSLGGSSWKKALKPSCENTLWQTRPGQYIKGSTVIEVSNTTNLTIYAISYSQSGEQIHRRNLGVIDATHPGLEFAFTAHPSASTIDFIVYVPAKIKSEPFKLRSFVFEWVSLTT
jgi:hypothetical protein